MSTTDNRYKAVKLELESKALIAPLVDLLRASGLADSCYAYKLRAKSEEKLIEKTARKQKEKNPNYQLESITDVLGLRLVALFKSDMIDLLSGCLHAISHFDGSNSNPFRKGYPEEIIFYKGNSAIDEMSTGIERVVNKCCGGNVSVKELNSTEGYSSIHIVSRLTCPALNKDFGTGYFLPIEIQIRTVFEDAWGEIDHKFGYVNRKGKNKGQPINNLENVLANLKVLKRFTDGCSEYSEVILQEATRTQSSVGVRTAVISVDMDDFLIVRLKELAVPDIFVQQYLESRRLKEAVLNVPKSTILNFDERCAEAADSFRQLSVSMDDLISGSDSSPGFELLYYYAKMNECLCVISINDRQNIEIALHAYKSLEARYPSYPLLRMRAGQAAGKLGYFNEAVERLREAGRLSEELRATVKSVGGKELWPDELPKTDYEHLSKTQPKLTGFYIWNQIQIIEDDSKKAEMYKEAYDITHPALAVVGQDEKLLLSYRNNLLYYALGYRLHAQKCSGWGEWSAEEVGAAVGEHLSYFDARFEQISDMAPSALDTLMVAYSLQNRPENAKKVAAVLQEKVLSATKPDADPALALRFIRKAGRILADQKDLLLD